MKQVVEFTYASTYYEREIPYLIRHGKYYFENISMIIFVSYMNRTMHKDRLNPLVDSEFLSYSIEDNKVELTLKV